MKFLQKHSPLAWWLLRTSILLFVVMRYIQSIKGLNVSSFMFYISLLFVVSSLMIFVGGFYKKGVLARVGGLILCLISGYQGFINIHAGLDYNLSMFALLASIGLVFLTRKDNV